jgi:carbon-monoxide dehydrogenase medium subunit
MRYCEPSSIDEAVAALAADPEARCLAGGATLVAMLNAGVIEPTSLVSLRRIESLCGIRRPDDKTISIGAMTTHRSVANNPLLTGGLAVVREAAAQIAHPGVRSIGTIGGSLAHADPNSDYPVALLASGATVIIAGRNGERQVPIDDFFVDVFQTCLKPSEMVTAVLLPTDVSENEAGTYYKFSRVEGDYATISVAVRLQLEGSLCSKIRIAVGSCSSVPLRLPEAEELLTQTTLGHTDLVAAAEMLVTAADPIDDSRGSSGYRRHLIAKLVPQAVRRAVDKMEISNEQ